MSKQSLQEQSVIDGLKRGDNWAYKHLYDYYYALLRKIALSFLKDDFLARTVVNELFARIYEKRETLTILPPLEPYLVRAVVNSCLNSLKAKHTKKEIRFSSMDTSDEELSFLGNQGNDNPLEILLEENLREEVRLSVERLPAQCRTVFEKSRFEGKSHKEIAAEMAISVATVKHHIGIALARLQKELGKFF